MRFALFMLRMVVAAFSVGSCVYIALVVNGIHDVPLWRTVVTVMLLLMMIIVMRWGTDTSEE